MKQDRKTRTEGREAQARTVRRLPGVVRACAVLLLVLLALLTAIQLVMPGRYDLTVLVAFEGALALEQREYLTTAIERYAATGRGGVAEVSLEVVTFDSITSPSDRRQYERQVEALQNCLSSGDAILMILDQPLCDYISRKGYLENLAARYPNNPRVDRYRCSLAGTSLLAGELMESLPDDLAICLRREDGVPLGIFNFNWPQRYAFALEVLDRLAADTVSSEFLAVDPRTAGL